MKRILISVSIILYVLLVSSCDGASVIIGNVSFLEENRSLPISLFLINVETGETSKYDTLINKNGHFKVRVREEGHFFIHLSILENGYYVNDDYLMSSPMLIEINDRIILNNLFISQDLELSVNNSQILQNNWTSIIVDWERIEGADIYALYITEAENQKDIKKLFITSDTMYSASFTAQTISFSESLKNEQIKKMVPFYRINQEIPQGEYIIRLAAIKFMDSGFESVISKSMSYQIFIE